jgi:hypothetical protein
LSSYKTIKEENMDTQENAKQLWSKVLEVAKRHNAERGCVTSIGLIGELGITKELADQFIDRLACRPGWNPVRGAAPEYVRPLEADVEERLARLRRRGLMWPVATAEAKRIYLGVNEHLWETWLEEFGQGISGHASELFLGLAKEASKTRDDRWVILLAADLMTLQTAESMDLEQQEVRPKELGDRMHVSEDAAKVACQRLIDLYGWEKAPGCQPDEMVVTNPNREEIGDSECVLRWESEPFMG